MARYVPPTSHLGVRIMDFRKSNKLTQANLADRYGVSGPAIFKFEKGFVTPSLNLWLKIANDIGIPEKEAVLLWVKEKLPDRLHPFIQESTEFDVAAMRAELEKDTGEGDDLKRMRSVILGNPEISPPLKKFVANNELWGILKPTADEILFLIELNRRLPCMTAHQFRDATIVAREIRNPSKG